MSNPNKIFVGKLVKLLKVKNEDSILYLCFPCVTADCSSHTIANAWRWEKNGQWAGHGLSRPRCFTYRLGAVRNESHFLNSNSLKHICVAEYLGKPCLMLRMELASFILFSSTFRHGLLAYLDEKFLIKTNNMLPPTCCWCGASGGCGWCTKLQILGQRPGQVVVNAFTPLN